MDSFLDFIEGIDATVNNGAIDLGDTAENVMTRDDTAFNVGIARTRASLTRRNNPRYRRALYEAVQLIDRVRRGITSDHWLREAMTRSDFALLLGDVLDRQMLGNYTAYVPEWRNYIATGTVRDFRGVNRFHVAGGESTLAEVKELDEYPAATLTPLKVGPITVKKFGRRMPFSFESLINDDLNALTDMPRRLALASRRSEARAATALFVGASGSLASLYSAGNANIITGNPVLSISSLAAAIGTFGTKVDSEGEPIILDMVELVVPPALQIVAENILNATAIEFTDTGASATQKIISNNWLRNRFRINVNPYIPLIATSANANTSWFLFASTSGTRPALEMDFLRGYDAPQLFMKSPNAIRIGGGGLVDPMLGDFDHDAVDYKVRHIFGGGVIDPKMTMASNGSGS